MQWIIDHYDTIVEVGAALYFLLSLLVGLTPSHKDDVLFLQIAQRLSFLAPKNASSTLSVPGARPPQGGSAGVDGIDLGVLLVIAVGSAWGPGIVGCAGTIQPGLAGGSEVLVQLSEDAVPFYAERDSVCRDRHPPLSEDQETSLRAERRDLYDACMSPVEIARTSRATLDRLLRAAQAAYDASGEDGFAAQVPCLLTAAEQLLTAITELSDEIPPQLPELIDFLRPFLTDQECSDV